MHYSLPLAALIAPLINIVSAGVVGHGHAGHAHISKARRDWDPSTVPTGECGGANGIKCSPGNCCSSLNWCGATPLHCGTGCQSAFGTCTGGNSTGSTGSGPISRVYTPPDSNNASDPATSKYTADDPEPNPSPVVGTLAETPPQNPPQESSPQASPPTSNGSGSGTVSEQSASTNGSTPDGGSTSNGNSNSGDGSIGGGAKFGPGSGVGMDASQGGSCQAIGAVGTTPAMAYSGAGDSTGYSCGSTSPTVWPSADQWLSYDALWDLNAKVLTGGCQAGVTQNSAQDAANINASILSVAQAAGLRPNFILAMVMQESDGCARVHTTAVGHSNPGLMQSFNGASCFGAASCPQPTILKMIQDGVQGTGQCFGTKDVTCNTGDETTYGPGLVQDMLNITAQAGDDEAKMYYMGARLYNGGSLAASGDLSGSSAGTDSYCSSVANRLMGWMPHWYSTI